MLVYEGEGILEGARGARLRTADRAALAFACRRVYPISSISLFGEPSVGERERRDGSREARRFFQVRKPYGNDTKVKCDAGLPGGDCDLVSLSPDLDVFRLGFT